MKKVKKGKTFFEKKGRPNLLSDGLMKKVKSIMIETWVAGTVISRCITMGIGNKLMRSNSPTLQGILKSMSWVKREGRQGK